jgi:hypothetical protein
VTSTTDATSPAAPGTDGVTTAGRPSGAGDSAGARDATNGRQSGAADSSDGIGPAARGVDPHDGLDDAGRRRLRRAWWRGAVPTLAAYLWVLTVGRADLLQVHYFDDFYDAQARSLMHGRLDVPPEVPGFEGFLIDGRTYIYFGPFPALLRMPVLAVTDRFDGRLTTLSMLLAAVVLAAASFRLLCSLRPLAQGNRPLGRREPLVTGLVAVVVLVAPPFFLASQAVVYHEATMWGIALAVAAFDAVLRWQRTPATRRLIVAALLILAALLARQSLGQGVLVALALSGLAVGVTEARRDRPDAPRWTAWPRALRSPRLLACAVACLLPFAVVVGLNYTKFGTLLSPPSDKHNQSRFSGERVEVLAANDGSLFGVQFVPSTLKQYLRPDGIDVRLDMPWIDFPRLGPSAVGETVFDKLDWSSSLPASAPALTAVTAVTLVWAVRSRRRRRGGPWLSPLLVGALAGAGGVLAVGYIANRYLTDLFPLVLIPGLLGAHLLVKGWDARPVRTRRLVATGLGALAVLGVLVNVVLAVEYQRERAPNVPESLRAEWSGWRASLPGSYEPLEVSPAAPWLPDSAFDSRMAVVGECDGLYERLDGQWYGLERSPAVGVYDLRLDLDDLPDDERVPVITLGQGPSRMVVAIRRVGNGLVRVDLSRPSGTSGGWNLGFPAALSGTVTLRVDADFRERDRIVSVGSEVLHSGPVASDSESPRIGAAPPGLGSTTRFPGEIAQVAPDMSLCERAAQFDDDG